MAWQATVGVGCRACHRLVGHRAGCAAVCMGCTGEQLGEQLSADISDNVVHTCSVTVAAAVYPGSVPQCRHRWQVRACPGACCVTLAHAALA